jgi:hypothetical protein
MSLNLVPSAKLTKSKSHMITCCNFDGFCGNVQNLNFYFLHFLETPLLDGFDCHIVNANYSWWLDTLM